MLFYYFSLIFNSLSEPNWLQIKLMLRNHIYSIYDNSLNCQKNRLCSLGKTIVTIGEDNLQTKVSKYIFVMVTKQILIYMEIVAKYSRL